MRGQNRLLALLKIVLSNVIITLSPVQKSGKLTQYSINRQCFNRLMMVGPL